MSSSSGILGRFVSALRGCGVQRSDRVAVALSGGPDSLALAAMTVWWHGFVRSQATPLALIVDHQLRPESSEEAAAVARQAEELGMLAQVLRVDWPAGQLPSPGDKMAAAREARYDLLLRACGEARRNALLLAHHADDQAETFLLRLMHASGVLGLACMPRAAEKRTERGRVRIVRPLLDFRKAELEDYCRQRSLAYVVDPTNAELSFHRNRIRHVMQQMPTLQGYPDLGAAGNAPGQPAGSTLTQQGEPMARPSSSGSSSAGRGSLTIVADILRLQRRCHAAAEQQRAQGRDLLRRAVLHTSAEDLPCAPPTWPLKPGQRLNQALLKLKWLDQQPWFLNWHKRLLQVADGLRPLRFALLDASCFAGLDEAVALGALSRILQSVSGRKYPPSLAQSIRLHTLLLPGRLDVTFTGGGCLVRRLPRSKGRYLVCVAETDWPAAEAALAQLPPATQAEVERMQRKQQQQQQQQQGGATLAATSASNDVVDSRAVSGVESVPAAPA